jgi:hypothetical protein
VLGFRQLSQLALAHDFLAKYATPQVSLAFQYRPGRYKTVLSKLALILLA